MREKLIQYIDLLFAGTSHSEDMKQEILQNTLDRYDDLIAQGKVPEAAYRISIAGIGDINELLGTEAKPVTTCTPTVTAVEEDTPEKKKNRAFAVGLYILSAIPLLLLSDFGMDILGLCLTLMLVAAATILMLRNRKPDADDCNRKEEPRETELQKSINTLIWVLGLIAYFVISFTTGAWYITWVVFPLVGAVQGLFKAILDLVEVNRK